MRVLVLCVVIEIVTALYTGQNQYLNYGNQIRRFKTNYYLPFKPNTRIIYQNRLNDGLGIGMLYPESNIFTYVSRPKVPYLIERDSNIFKHEELRRIPYIVWGIINRLVFTKTPKMHHYRKIILYRYLLKELMYKLRHENVNIKEIRNLIIKLLQRKKVYILLNANKMRETDLSKFSSNKIKKSGSYKEAIENSRDLPFKDKLNVLGKKIRNEQIQNIAKLEYGNNFEVSGKQNPKYSGKNIIKKKNLNISGNVSNIAHKSIIRTNEDNAITNKTIMKSKINNLYNNYKTVYNKGNLLAEEYNQLNKNNEDQRFRSLSRQNDITTFNNKKHSNQKTLNYELLKDGYHIDSLNDVLRKNPTIIKTMPEPEKSINYNIKNVLGYHNLHQISQSANDLNKTAYNKKSIYENPALDNFSKEIQNKEYQIIKPKVEYDTRHVEYIPIKSKQDVRGTVTENLLAEHTSTIDQNKNVKYNVPLEFEVEVLNKSSMPYYLPEIIRTGKSNNNGKESSLNVTVKGSDPKQVLTTKDRRDEESLEVKNINENDLHKITILKGTLANLLIDAMEPIKITKTYGIRVEETKFITFGDQSEIDKNNKKTNPENMYNFFFLKDNDHETSDDIKIDNNNVKNNLLHVILNNLSLSNDRNYKNNYSNNERLFNKHITFLKSVKHQSDFLHGKEPILVFEKDYDQYKDAKRYEAKNHLCVCKQTDSTEKIKEHDDLSKKVQSIVPSTTLNKNVKIWSKNIQHKNQVGAQSASDTSYQNKKYDTYNKALTGYGDIEKESIHLVKRRADYEEQDNTKETSNVMTNKDKVISNILAPEDVKSDKKPLPYWLPSDAQDVYEILQQPPKQYVLSDSLDLEMPFKEEIDKIVQLKKELGTENLEEIITLKVNTVGIGKATNIIDKLIPSMYDVYLKNFITKILYRLRQELSKYELTQQKNEVKNLDIHEIRKASSILDIFENIRDVFNKQDDESLYDILVSLLRFNKQSDEDFDEEVAVILDSVKRKSIYGVLRHFLVPEPTLNTVREYLNQQELYPKFKYYKVLDDILPNLRIIIINALAIESDKYDDIHKNEETMEKLVKILIKLNKVMKDLGIPETTQMFIIEESILAIIRNLANAYIKNYEETVYVQIKKQLQDALYNNINV